MTKLEEQYRDLHWTSLGEYNNGFHDGKDFSIYSDLLDESKLEGKHPDYRRGFQEGFERNKEE